MRISDWSSDVCSSDLPHLQHPDVRGSARGRRPAAQQGGRMKPIAVGQPIPAFTAQSTQGQVSLDSLRGHRTVLYFYPKDSTPGCTTQAQGLRDAYQEFVDAGCQIIGVSRDSLKSHDNFTEKQNLPFPLISDADEALCQMFDVIKMKNM